MRSAKSMVAVAAIAGLMAAACGKSTPSTTTSTSPEAIKDAASLSADGSTFAQPLYIKWGTDFNTSNHVQVSYTGGGSSKGISDLLAKTVDFAGTDAPYVPTETTTDPIINVPTALGAVAVTYNLSGVPKLQLSGKTLADIFQGKIATWSDPEIAADNAGVSLPGTAITIVHRSDGSGTTFIFTSYLSAVSSDFKSAIGAGKGPTWPTTAQFKAGAKSTGVDQVVKSTDGAIGYVELTYADQNKTQTALIQNADKTHFLAPSVTTTAAAAAKFDASTLTGPNLVFNLLNQAGDQAYPIAGPTYAILYQKQANGSKGKAVVDFLNWGLTTGQADEAALDYVALPAALAAKCIAALKTVTFNGTPLLAG